MKNIIIFDNQITSREIDSAITMNATPARWYYADSSNETKGPVSRPELDSLFKSGEIRQETFVVQEGGQNWIRYEEILPVDPEVENALPPPPPPSTKKSNSHFIIGLALTCLFCSPIGIIWAFLSKRLSRKQKIVICSLGVLWFMLAQVPFVAGIANDSGERARPQATNSESSASSNSASSSHDETPENGNSGHKLIKMGEMFELGDFAYTIEYTDSQSSIGHGPLEVDASSDGEFLIVSYSIENISNETKTVISDDFILVDKKGRRFRASSKATTALAMDSDDKDWLVSELQPGIVKDTMTAFEVPSDLDAADLILVVREKGFLSNKVVGVKLE